VVSALAVIVLSCSPIYASSIGRGSLGGWLIPFLIGALVAGAVFVAASRLTLKGAIDKKELDLKVHHLVPQQIALSDGASVNFGQAIAAAFSNYANFSGRATRSEYWLWQLFVWIAGVAVFILDNAIFSNPLLYPLSDIFSLVIILPNLAVAARRLHDIDRSAWWLLNWLTIVGGFPIIYCACKKGTPGVNRFGPDPFAEVEQIGPRSPT
jgi:uncharacterized membrane protein YhaH (DUF805 family)